MRSLQFGSQEMFFRFGYRKTLKEEITTPLLKVIHRRCWEQFLVGPTFLFTVKNLDRDTEGFPFF